MSFASFSSARPAMRRACSSELRVPVVPFLGGSVARVAVVSTRHGPADALGTLADMTTDQKGAIAETAIAAAAVKLGIGVARPLAPERYDFIFDLGSRLIRVQCKWAVVVSDVVLVRCYRSRRSGTELLIRSYSIDEIDAVAAYCAELHKCYFIPFDQFARRRGFHLRLAPTRNNQRRGILWAEHFEFAATLGHGQGAIAQLGERLDGIQKVAGSSPAGSI
jgi:hypothetical protein